MSNKLETLKSKVQKAAAILESRLPAESEAEIRRSLGYVFRAIEELSEPAPAASATIDISEVCRFLMARGEGLRPAGFEKLEVAASKPENFRQVEYAIAGVVLRLGDHAPKAKQLLEEAAALGKALEWDFAMAPDVPLKPHAGSRLRLADACRVVERLFRFESTASIERVTGVPRALIEQMHSAAAFHGRREGWGDVR